MKRNDIHSPANIKVEDYQFLCCLYSGSDPFMQMAMAYGKKILMDAVSRGHKFSRHEHGGTCHICGAHAVHTAVFIHVPSGDMIKTGMDCAEKMDMDDANAFRNYRKCAADARKRKAGLAKARLLLADHGMEAIADADVAGGLLDWSAMHNRTDLPGMLRFKQEERIATVRDIYRRLVSYGNLSEAQWKFMARLWAEIQDFNPVAIVAKREAEKAQMGDISDGRQDIEGEVVSIKLADYNAPFPQDKMLVKLANGAKVFGSIPGSICRVHRGQHVKFSAAVQRKEKGFGYFSRPTKAAILEVA